MMYEITNVADHMAQMVFERALAKPDWTLGDMKKLLANELERLHNEGTIEVSSEDPE